MFCRYQFLIKNEIENKIVINEEEEFLEIKN